MLTFFIAAFLAAAAPSALEVARDRQDRAALTELAAQAGAAAAKAPDDPEALYRATAKPAARSPSKASASPRGRLP
jgi:hypothetical protein